MNSPLQTLAVALRQEARITRQRRVLVVAGGYDWCVRTAQEILRAAAIAAPVWLPVPTTAPGIRVTGGANGLLGQDIEATVIDVFRGFDPNAFGAASGAVVGGGFLLLLVPPLQEWPDYADPQAARLSDGLTTTPAPAGRFVRRLASVLAQSRDVTLIQESIEPQAPSSPALAIAASVEEAGADGCRTTDQSRALAALLRTATGRARRPVVLVSDRGRGKSAALGLAAARLLRAGKRRVLITGPRLDAVIPALRHAAEALPGATRRAGQVRLGGASLEFVPPDALCLARHPADMVLVDEAATLPAPLLESLLRRYARIAFATTVHGYEGTGRGFAVRFRHTLDRLTPDWREVVLATPIRWAPDDPLERLTFRALLLDADAAPAPVLAGASAAGCDFARLDRDALVRDEATLSELFGLLVLAHYQTSPWDLRHLLDAPGVGVWVLRHRGRVAATALTTEEGGLGKTLREQIYQGRRRLRGHLVPQTLSQHLGLAEAPLLRGLRVMRIAVHPVVQGCGLGRRLLREIGVRGREQGQDYLGTSFGADPELLRFWIGSRFLPVRLGITRDGVSGSHAAVLLHPLSPAGEALAVMARARFARHLPDMLNAPLRDLDPRIAGLLLQGAAAESASTLDDQDWRDLAGLAFARRSPETCLAPLRRLALRILTEAPDGADPEPALRILLLARVLQGQSWKKAATRAGLAGHKAALATLRRGVRPWVLRLGGELAYREALRLGADRRELGDRSLH